MKIIFWACLLLIAYTYLIYPSLIILLARIFPKKPLTNQKQLHHVTMVISAYNEEKVLEEKIKNCLTIDYPQDRIRFLFG